MKSTGIIIIGGTGYGAGELLRLLSFHPEIDVVQITSRGEANKPVQNFHSFLRNYPDLCFSKTIKLDLLKGYTNKIIFSALPHGVSAKIISEEIVSKSTSEDIKIIDLSGDFRLKNHKIHKEYYPHTGIHETIRDKFIYGLSEINREEIKAASYIANPGCFVTATSLSLYPISKYQVSSQVVVDGKTGTSGGGKEARPIFHHAIRNANIQNYKVLNHQHEPEMKQILNLDNFIFVPHLIPISRGILITAYLQLKDNLSDLHDLYKDFYKNSPFIRICKEPVELRNVIGSNFCDINIENRDKQVVITATIDNLVKGMAGQAIQNMNLMCGFKETLGLTAGSIGLC